MSRNSRSDQLWLGIAMLVCAALLAVAGNWLYSQLPTAVAQRNVLSFCISWCLVLACGSAVVLIAMSGVYRVIYRCGIGDAYEMFRRQTLSKSEHFWIGFALTATAVWLAIVAWSAYTKIPIRSDAAGWCIACTLVATVTGYSGIYRMILRSDGNQAVDHCP